MSIGNCLVVNIEILKGEGCSERRSCSREYGKCGFILTTISTPVNIDTVSFLSSKNLPLRSLRLHRFYTVVEKTCFNLRYKACFESPRSPLIFVPQSHDPSDLRQGLRSLPQVRMIVGSEDEIQNLQLRCHWSMGTMVTSKRLRGPGTRVLIFDGSKGLSPTRSGSNLSFRPGR